VITYVDTSVLLKLLLDDEVGVDAAERLWLESDFVVCAEIGYSEARAALASARRSARLDDAALLTAKAELETLWAQVDVVPVTTEVVHAAGDLAEVEGLRGYDAVHLAAAIAAEVTVVATADDNLLAAARRRRYDVANPRWSRRTYASRGARE
jgi:predicted nucleic acid-binding protein